MNNMSKVLTLLLVIVLVFFVWATTLLFQLNDELTAKEKHLKQLNVELATTKNLLQDKQDENKVLIQLVEEYKVYVESVKGDVAEVNQMLADLNKDKIQQ